MKKNFSILSLLMLLLAGCDVHEFPDIEEIVPPSPPAPEKPRIEAVITLENTDWPEHLTISTASESRAARVSDHKMRYTLNIYAESDGRGMSRTIEATETVIADVPQSYSDVSQIIPIVLEPGNYEAIVWVDYVDALIPESNLYYIIEDFANISLMYDGYTHAGNTHQREAFRGATSFSVTADGNVVDTDSRTTVERIPISAERPMARFEFITTDLEEYAARTSRSDGTKAAAQSSTPDPDDYKVQFRYTGYMPSVYNAHIDKPIDSAIGVSFTGSTTVLSATEASLGFDHILVNGTEANIQVALDVYDSHSGALISSIPSVSVPLKRNRHTIVRGAFLTSKASGGIGINTDFDGNFNIEIL